MSVHWGVIKGPGFWEVKPWEEVTRIYMTLKWINGWGWSGRKRYKESAQKSSSLKGNRMDAFRAWPRKWGRGN